MNERQKQIEAAFHQAEDCSSAEDRAKYLNQLGVTDPELRQEVDALLQWADAADVMFQRDGKPSEPLAADEQRGMCIGRYRLLEKLGEGGMGVVYLAEQLEPVRRRVALKIIKSGMDTRPVVARFEAERQALAVMDHPNIAKIYDGGVLGVGDAAGQSTAPGLSAGRPYFAMEFVDGEPITEFCRTRHFTMSERLRLIIAVCQAVQHAHQKGIIHRDLKPSNVLVTLQDGKEVPKIIDFGVAKAIDQKLSEQTVFTQHALLIGTPAYMSPEQADLNGGDIDTRSDIYSLGILLYELITGRPPFDTNELLRSGLDEMRRVIREQEPVRPSTRLRRDTVAGVPPVRRDSGLDTDLDWIVLKCLEKDRNRRYATANGLADDLRRHLEHEPVSARPPSRWYAFRKAVRRHRVGFMATAAVGAALAVGVAVSTFHAARARKAERLARQQCERATLERARAEKQLRATVQLLNEAFSKVVPALNYTIGASQPRHALTKAGARIVEELLRGAEPEPEMRVVVGELYQNLSLGQANYVGTTTGEYAEGLEAAKRATQLLQPRHPPPFNDDEMHRLAVAEMCAVFAAKGLMKYDKTLEHLERMREWSRRLAQSTNALFADRGRQKLEWVRALTGETLEQMGRTEEALTNYYFPLLSGYSTQPNDAPDEFALEHRRWDLRDGFNSVGRCLLKLGRPREALEHLRRAVPVAEDLATGRPTHSAFAAMLAESKARLGEALLAVGQAGEARPLLESALREAEYLQRCDPANAGFMQLQVVVLQCHASGFARGAARANASDAEHREFLEQAQDYLGRARRLTSTLPSESLRDFLNQELRQTSNDVENARTGQGRSATVPTTAP